MDMRWKQQQCSLHAVQGKEIWGSHTFKRRDGKWHLCRAGTTSNEPGGGVEKDSARNKDQVGCSAHSADDDAVVC